MILRASSSSRWQVNMASLDVLDELAIRVDVPPFKLPWASQMAPWIVRLMSFTLVRARPLFRPRLLSLTSAPCFRSPSEVTWQPSAQEWRLGAKCNRFWVGETLRTDLELVDRWKTQCAAFFRKPWSQSLPCFGKGKICSNLFIYAVRVTVVAFCHLGFLKLGLVKAWSGHGPFTEYKTLISWACLENLNIRLGPCHRKSARKWGVATSHVMQTK